MNPEPDHSTYENGIKSEEEDLSCVDSETPLTQSDNNNRNIRYKCVKNCFLISLIFYFHFTAINSLSSIASSLNDETVVAMSVYAFTNIIGSYISPAVIPKIGGKSCIVISLVSAMAYISMVFYPRYYTLVPLSVIAGVSIGLAWTVQMMYCTNVAIVYARVSKKPVESIIEYSYGIFFVFFALSQVTGNLISSSLLGLFSNTTIPSINNSALCAARFCPEYAHDNSVIKRPTQNSIQILILIYLGFLTIGILLTIFGLDRINNFIQNDDDVDSTTLNQKLLSPLKVLVHPNMMLLIMLYVYTGIEQNVIGSDYNEAYVTCILGVSFVGYSMICYGVSGAIGSLTSGLLGPIIGRATVISSVLIIILGSHFFLLYGNLQQSSLGYFFIAPITFGISDGALRTQINALVGLLFTEDQEAAYAVINMLTVFGFGIVFAYNTAFCITTKFYISIALLCFSLILYRVFHCKTGKNLAKYTS